MSKNSERFSDWQVQMMQNLHDGPMQVTASELANPEVRELFRLGYVQKVDCDGMTLWGLTDAGHIYLKDWT